MLNPVTLGLHTEVPILPLSTESQGLEENSVQIKTLCPQELQTAFLAHD
jgi:hypothetical protein